MLLFTLLSSSLSVGVGVPGKHRNVGIANVPSDGNMVEVQLLLVNKTEQNKHSLSKLTRIPVHLLIYVVIQLAKHVVAIQCIKSYRGTGSPTLDSYRQEKRSKPQYLHDFMHSAAPTRLTDWRTA